MFTYINYNASLENMRRYADVEQMKLLVSNKLKEQPEIDDSFDHKTCDDIFDNEATTFGPRVLIMGPTNSGKATLAKILSNFSVRCGHNPILADLDTNLNMITVPGCVAAVGMHFIFFFDFFLCFHLIFCNYPCANKRM